VGSPIDLDVLEFGAAAYQVYARKDQRVAIAVSREQRSVAQEDGERVGSRVSKEVARAGSRSQAGGGPRGERSERERDPGGGGSGSASLPSSRDGSIGRRYRFHSFAKTDRHKEASGEPERRPGADADVQVEQRDAIVGAEQAAAGSVHGNHGGSGSVARGTVRRLPSLGQKGTTKRPPPTISQIPHVPSTNFQVRSGHTKKFTQLQIRPAAGTDHFSREMESVAARRTPSHANGGPSDLTSFRDVETSAFRIAKSAT
jgi:hypothetical protein